MRILDGPAVHKLFPIPDAIDVMRAALVAFSAGRVRQPARTILPGAAGDVFAVMPAYVPLPDDQHRDEGGERGVFGVKTIAVKPANPARGLPPHVGLVLLLDPDTATPVALVDATSVTAIRTAAASAVATAALARPDAGVLAILGSGTQARTHLRAMSVVRDLRQVRVWSRNRAHAAAFAEWAAAEGGPAVAVAGTAADAVAGADLVCTTTASTEPVLSSAAVADGAHINAVGAVFPNCREVAADLVARASVFVDSRESALRESGDLRFAIAEERFHADDIRGEIGEVLAGGCPGRTGAEEVTVFESLGIAVEDVLSAQFLSDRATELDLGVEVQFGP